MGKAPRYLVMNVEKFRLASSEERLVGFVDKTVIDPDPGPYLAHAGSAAAGSPLQCLLRNGRLCSALHRMSQSSIMPSGASPTARLEANLPSIERLEAELTEADIHELEKIHHGADGDSVSTPSTAKPRPTPDGKRHGAKTAKTSPGKKPQRSKKPSRSQKAGR